ncbi:uncharacterized protein K452DRAFT_336513 [Aplosporella prunicola CBS 121167]|uniref:Zn(2)-C6 fungal-type domain-containing protein n=1 Tax=Aplosporella prunicola CBS 121167 TaxID=1176127 RepID=A0A6A6B8A2_9PEZI|nr:uncharacterized protein K452DRAFT_336513 [Aplosporella prunicola CBS 121167]KAF2139778.1 hypothetical protein K452DRAFT_336513 [Aplosporella prunicola CBS 121167]
MDRPSPARRGNALSAKVNSACQRCRRHKSRCDLFRPCTLCVRADVECVSASHGETHASTNSGRRRRVDEATHEQSRVRSPTPACANARQPSVYESNGTQTPQFGRSSSNVDYGEAESTMGITRKIFQLGRRTIDNRAISAIPDGEVVPCGSSPNQASLQKRPISAILSYSLPSRQVTEMLLEEYFDSVHWFSLVIHEPIFRKQYESVADGFGCPDQKGFLILLTTVLGIAAWYLSQKGIDGQSQDTEDMKQWSSELLRHTESQMYEIITEASLVSVQTCILLGSYGLYHGKPSSSFALLGAAIKTGQALGLHRETSRGEVHDREERKRVWWTIYTWDRFASITYGKPLGINDKDCNVSMPAEFVENCRFDREKAETPICYSAYQRELNMLYLIASPMLETIFGIRTSGSLDAAAMAHHSALIDRIHEQLTQWRQQLPSHLVFNLNKDCQLDPPAQVKAHRLQSLSLQLTYDNIVVVLHRPFLAQQVDDLFKALTDSRPEPLSTSTASAVPQYPVGSGMSSSELWWNAAVQTSRVTELPHLAQLATDTHLVAFLAINLFNSAIVMVVCALSDPLSDRAQEAKRTITRIYRLQELVGRRSKLSMQSSVVLQDVIRLLLNRVAEAMLAPIVAPARVSSNGADGSNPVVQPGHPSVEDTLRLPLSVPRDTAPYFSTAVAHTGKGTEILDHALPQDTSFNGQNHGSADFQSGLATASTPVEWDTLSSGLYGDNDLYWIWNTITD